MKTEHCRSCGKDVVWLKTAAGRAMPVDAATVKEGDELFAMKTKANPDGYHISHFATCAHANRWRKSG